MKTIKAGTEVKVHLDMGYGDVVKHGIVTSVVSPGVVMARIGHTTPVRSRGTGRTVIVPSSHTHTLVTPVSAAEGDVT